MNNYIYVLSNQQNVQVEKLHICTWDIREQKASLKLGLMISNENLQDQFDIYIFAPFFKTDAEISSLHNKLHEPANFKFIFNEEVNSDIPLDTGRIGHIVNYRHNGEDVSIAIINVTPEKQDGHIKINIRKPERECSRIYFRLLVKTNWNSLANISSGNINKKIYKYDFKVNEYRNEPDTVSEFQREEQLYKVEVESAYCLHCLPDNYELSYTDNRKLQSVRLLEKEAFCQYLDELNTAEGDYIIAFLKDNIGKSFSFFTAFSREYIGNQDIIIAIIINLFCTIFISSLPNDCIKKDGCCGLPNFLWLSLIILLIIILWAIKKYIIKIFNKIWKR